MLQMRQVPNRLLRIYKGWLGCTAGLLLVGCTDSPITPPLPPPISCNGRVENCQRRYDQVTFAATHNAFTYATGGPVSYTVPNQDLPISNQLESGIRGLGIRPCPSYNSDPAEAERVYVTHNFALKGALGMEPLLNILQEVRTFLERNPVEVVTLFAESDVTPAAIAATFAEAGLLPYLYVHDAKAGWPTLGEMAERNTRLVVFNDSEDPMRPPWQHYLWNFIVDTDYNITDIKQFRCDFNRGTAQNPLYFLNQFIYLDLGGGVVIADRDLSQQANDPTFIVNRAKSCWQQTGRIPNFIYVDWYGQGDVVGAVETLNQIAR